jgi:hypothetical protein
VIVRKFGSSCPSGSERECDADANGLRLVPYRARPGDTKRTRVSDSEVGNKAPDGPRVLGLLPKDVPDASVVAGFESKTFLNRSWMHPASIRIRARVAAAELVLMGVSKPRQAQVGSCIGRSGRTVIDHFDGFDSMFAFPPPELASVVVEAWLSSRSPDEFVKTLSSVFVTLSANPIARRLLLSVARVHHQDRSRAASDGHFAFALAIEMQRHDVAFDGIARWCGFVTEALREAILASSEDGQTLEDIAPALIRAFQPVPFPGAPSGRDALVG